MATDIQVPDPNGTIDLQQQVARLQALLEASRHVHSTIREDEVLESVLRIVVRELEMAGAAFPGTGLAYGEEIPENGNGAAALPGFPLNDRDGRAMTELKVAPPDGRELTLYEADFLEGLALQAAVALENARNHKRNVEFARVQQDLDSAREIQRSLLPQELPKVSGYSVGFKSTTCYEVGGDYLDILELAGRQPADGGGGRGRQRIGFGDDVDDLPVGVPGHGGERPGVGRACRADEPAPLAGGRRGAAAVRDGDFSAALSGQGRDGGRQLRGTIRGLWCTRTGASASSSQAARRWGCCRGCATK